MSQAEVTAALRVIGAVARADGKISDEERKLFRSAVAELVPVVEGKSLEDLLTEPSDLEADLAAVTSPVVRRAVFEVAYAMATSDGAVQSENDVLKKIRNAFSVESGDGQLDDFLRRRAYDLPVSPALDPVERQARVKAVLARRTMNAAILGALPIPFVGDVGVLLQLGAVVDEISILWGQPLTGKEKWTRFASILSIAMAQSAAHSLVKMIPGWGTLAGAVSGAVVSYVAVGAVGRAVNHFYETDGKATPAELRKVFSEEKGKLRKEYGANEAKVEQAKAAHGAELTALAERLAAKEITSEEYERKVNELLGQASAS
ncbi:MAG: TerB family tellurite resistance protein [Labilithrix sp.]|nr:TerB family tellurite resistance protein [Labilithrix sp.]MCW5815840.1 TerB family tellurite resistance protein [Labilithrix sp.]